jgi:hypothetical protein
MMQPKSRAASAAVVSPEFTCREFLGLCPQPVTVHIKLYNLHTDSPGISFSQKPRYCRRMNIEKPRGISGSFGAR